MTCAVPHCTEPIAMQGVCSAHWLEADEAAYGEDRIKAELAAIRAEQAAAHERRARLLEEARRRRVHDPFDRRADGILNRIVDRFWAEAEQAGRNNALAAAAWAAGRLVAGGELEAEATTTRLVTEATSAGLPWREARDVVRGQIARARTRPRVLEREPIGKRWSRA